MKLRKLAKQLTAAAVAGCMALSLSMPALAETWNFSNHGTWPYIVSTADGQTVSFDFTDRPASSDADPVLEGSGEHLRLEGVDHATARATLQDVHLEQAADSFAAMDVYGDVDLTLSGSNTAVHTLSSAVDVFPGSAYDSSTGWEYYPSLLTINGSGKLAVTGVDTGIYFHNYNSTSGCKLDVAGGTLTVDTTDRSGTGIRNTDGTVQVSGGTLDIRADTGIDVGSGTVQVSSGTLTTNGSTGIRNSGGTVQVDGGRLDITATYSGIYSNAGKVLVNNGALTVSGATGLDFSSGTVQVNGGKLDATGSNYGINVTTVLVNDGTLTARASAAEGIGNAAVNAGHLTMNGGVLNVENNQAYYGIFANLLEVKDGWLAAKGQTVFVQSSAPISGGWVDADTLRAGSIPLSGGNVKLKNMPAGTVSFSGSARLTIDTAVSRDGITALAEAFQNGETTRSAYLKYIPEDPSDLPEGAVMEGGYAVLHGKDVPDEGKVYNDADKPGMPGEVEIEDTGSAPAGSIGGAIAAAAIGGAAIWGGYEVATRVILHQLLPAGAAIPKTQAELAVLLWTTAGSPEPLNAPAFADVDETTAKAAQWCTEQGYLTDTFQPDKHVAKYNVIRAWKKAFPKAK